MPTPALPPPIDYDGAWIGGIVPALLSPGGSLQWKVDQQPPAWIPKVVVDASTVVLVVLDGLGWASLQANDGRTPNLMAMAGGPISSAFPSTTATGLTSITTGVPASQHGITGYSMRVGGQVMSALQWRIVGGNAAPHANTVQTQPVFGGHPVPVVTKTEFQRSGFSKAHLGTGPFVGWQTPAVMIEQVRELVQQQHDLIYVYYDGIDRVAHAHGTHSASYQAELTEADRLVGRLRDALPPDAVQVVTADHGQVDIPAEGKLQLDAVARMVSAYAGEGRARGLFARPGASGDLYEACAE